MYKGEAFPDGSKGPHSYWFGWWAGELRGLPFAAHRGSCQGFRSAIERFQDDALTVEVLPNIGFGHPTEIAPAVAGLYNTGYVSYTPLPDQFPSSDMLKFTINYLRGEIDPLFFSGDANSLLDKAQIPRSAKNIADSEDTLFEQVFELDDQESKVLTCRITDDESLRVQTVTYIYDKQREISKTYCFNHEVNKLIIF